MDHPWWGWLLTPIGFTQAGDSTAEALRIQQRFFAKLGAGFLPGLFGAIAATAMVVGVYREKFAQQEQQVGSKADMATTNLLLQQNAADHLAILRSNEAEDARLKELERGREENRLLIERMEREIAELRTNQKIVLKRLHIGD